MAKYKTFLTGIVTNCLFSHAGNWELVNLFVGTKKFSYHICYENIEIIAEKIAKCSESRDRQTMDKQN